jgi:hypothetical protein
MGSKKKKTRFKSNKKTTDFKGFGKKQRERLIDKSNRKNPLHLR